MDEEMVVDEVNSILNYAEAPRVGDWTLRSATVRLAQPHPLRSEAVMQLVRRLDAALKPSVRPLQKFAVRSKRSIPGGADDIVDIRLVDIVAGGGPTNDLTDDEQGAAVLVQLALRLDELGNILAAWADAGSAAPPLDAVDRTCGEVLGLMVQHDVPEEQQWDGPGRPGRGV